MYLYTFFTLQETINHIGATYDNLQKELIHIATVDSSFLVQNNGKYSCKNMKNKIKLDNKTRKFLE